MEFSGVTDKHSVKKYESHDLEKAVDEKMKVNSKSFRDKKESNRVISPYTGHDNTQKLKYTPLQNVNNYPQYGYDQKVQGMQRGSSTMMGRYNQPISRARRKTRRPKMVVKNGKLLISKKNAPK